MLGARVGKSQNPGSPGPGAGRPLGVLLDADDLVARESHEDRSSARERRRSIPRFRAVGIGVRGSCVPASRSPRMTISRSIPTMALFLDGFWNSGGRSPPLHRRRNAAWRNQARRPKWCLSSLESCRERASEVEKRVGDPLIAWCGVEGWRWVTGRRGHTAQLDLDFVAPACFAPPRLRSSQARSSWSRNALSPAPCRRAQAGHSSHQLLHAPSHHGRPTLIRKPSFRWATASGARANSPET